MSPTARTLQVLEYIMAAGPGPIKQVDIARDCGLSPSTLNRIVKTLSDWGYLFRTSEKYCVRNFRLERNVPMSETYLAKLDDTMRALSRRFGISAEVVVVAGHELLWHSKTDHPDPNVLIRANVGFRRSLYELDALSQLYLSRLSAKEFQARFYSDGFFATVRDADQKTRWLSAATVKRKLEAMREHAFAADLEGNHMGIRRFATVVEDPDGKFLHLLTLAEPVSELSNEKKTVQRYRDALLKARKDLADLVVTENAAYRPRPKHHVLPQQGG
ncbi:MAG: MarR family transcriptional regulator [Granulosicoccus sp.]|nr:MarR family transcriptional regulator [Granulosicoccus sp.]